MKFFSTQKIAQIDRLTIEKEPISSIDLMERASRVLYRELVQRFPAGQSFCIFAGPGNNGGDALAVARMLLTDGYPVGVFLIRGTASLSPDCETNRQRLAQAFPDRITEPDTLPIVQQGAVVVDGLFGSGLSRPLSGRFAEVVEQINRSNQFVVAIDIPSGLNGEENRLSEESAVVKAHLTLTLQFPKLAFLLPENASYTGEWKVIDIGLHPDAIDETPSSFYFLEEHEVVPLLKPRAKFSHKGTFGHALLVAGSKGMAGAAILATRAALRSGAGLVTLHSAAVNNDIVQISVPEAISSPDQSEYFISEIPNAEHYSSIGIGPGIGTNELTQTALERLFKEYPHPCVIDADALNILSLRPDLWDKIPRMSILTPHPKEFDRLFGVPENNFDRIAKAQTAAGKHQCIIILKGAHTLIATPEGKLWFNSTGNTGMATAGAGDVLTGILTGLLAQGYTPENAAKLGVFLHGRAGDLAIGPQSEESLLAGDLIDFLGKAFQSLR